MKPSDSPQRTASPSPKRLVFCHGDKGGVGKSTFARVLAEWYSDNAVQWQGFDTDATNGHLCRFYPAHTVPVILSEDGSIDQILNAATGDRNVLLVDLGARTGDIIQRWCQETDLLSVKDELGLAITICFLLDPVKDSTSLLKEVTDHFADHCSYVLVKNQANGLRFSLYDGSNTRKRLLTELQAVEIELPELLSITYQQVDEGNLGWSAASKNTKLQLAARQRVKGFLKQAFAQLEGVKGLLLA